MHFPCWNKCSVTTLWVKKNITNHNFPISFKGVDSIKDWLQDTFQYLCDSKMSALHLPIFLFYPQIVGFCKVGNSDTITGSQCNSISLSMAFVVSLLRLKFAFIWTSALPMGFLPDSHPLKLMINYSMIKSSSHQWCANPNPDSDLCLSVTTLLKSIMVPMICSL